MFRCYKDCVISYDGFICLFSTSDILVNKLGFRLLPTLLHNAIVQKAISTTFVSYSNSTNTCSYPHDFSFRCLLKNIKNCYQKGVFHIFKQHCFSKTCFSKAVPGLRTSQFCIARFTKDTTSSP